MTVSAVTRRTPRSTSPSHSGSRRERTRRDLATVLSAMLIGSALALTPVSVVNASELPVATVAELEAAFASATDGDIVALAPSFPDSTIVTAPLTVAHGDTVILSLNRHDLTISSGGGAGTLSVEAGSSLTVRGAGTLTVLNSSTGGPAVAGSGTVRISSATFIATGTRGYDSVGNASIFGGNGGAGIAGDLILENRSIATITGGKGGNATAIFDGHGGSGAAAVSGSLRVSGGSIATLIGGTGGGVVGNTSLWSGAGGAGVAGGLSVDGDGSTVVVTGGNSGSASGTANVRSGPGGPGVAGATSVGDKASVTANGGSAGSARATDTPERGAGASGLAGAVTVGTGSVVVTGGTGSPAGSVIGAGSDVSVDAGGTLTISGGLWQVTAAVAVASSGLIVNSGTISGDGTLKNSGTVRNTGTVSVAVDGNNYNLSFDSAGGSATPDIRIYAPTLAAAGIELAVPTMNHSVFVSWNTVDGQTPVDGETELSTLANGSGLLSLVALWSEATISGDPVEGEPLTATLTNPALPVTYQWTADDVDIASATGRTFTPGDSQIGAAIAVKVTFAGFSGYASGSTASTTRTAAVQGTYVYGTVTVDGTPRFGVVLTARTDGAFDPSPTNLDFQWYTHESDGNGDFTDVAIPGANAAKFTPAESQVGSAIRVAVSPNLSNYQTTPQWSAATAAVLPAQFSTVPTIAIAGDPLVGSTLSVELTGSFDPAAFVTYQWLSNGTPIAEATGADLAVTDSNAGAEISVIVTGERLSFEPENIESAAVGPVLRQFSTIPLTISGRAKVGETISVDPTEAFEPFDGVDFSFVWSYGDGTGPWTVIDDADSASLTIPGSLVGSTLMVSVSATRAGYAPTHAPSYPTAEVRAGSFTVSELVISGTAQVGQTLEIDAHRIFTPTPTSVTVQWFADGDPIDGATLENIVIKAGQAGMVISVSATAHRDAYLDAQGSSARSSAVLSAPVVSVSPLRDIYPGTEITITGKRFVTEPTLSVELHSEPVVLTTVTPDGEGSFTASAAVPESTEPGTHSVVVLDQDGAIVAEARIDVSEAPAPAPSPSATDAPAALAATGTSLPVALVYSGLLALVLGAILLAAARVRRARH